MATTLTPTLMANSLIRRYRPGFELLPNEEMVIGDDFFDASQGMTKGITSALILRKLDLATVATLVSANAAALTFPSWTDYAVTVSPTFDWTGVELGLDLLARIEDEAAYQTAFKTQMVAGLATTMDAACGALGPSLTTNITGSSADILTQALFLAAHGKLVVSAKERFKVGKTRATCVIYNKQVPNMVNIPAFTYSYIRGDGSGPIVKGWVNDAMNVTIKESGNIYASAGTAHNLMWVSPAFVKAYNLKPTLLDPQPFELAVRLLAGQDRGVQIYFDQLAVDMQTTSN